MCSQKYYGVSVDNATMLCYNCYKHKSEFIRSILMKKAIKMTGRILLILLILLLLFTLVTFIIHRVKTNQEISLLKEKGYYNPVSVGDYCLNAAKFGNKTGRHTIVSLSGIASGEFSVTERKMTAALEQDNLVVFIDRAGYGLSDDTEQDMTIEHIIEDYRNALRNDGIAAPYLLMAHSLGGAYATYWESKYPDEIEAVVLLDGAQLSEDAPNGQLMHPVGIFDRVWAFLSKLGFGRYVSSLFYHLPDSYSEEDQRLCDALMLRTEGSVALASESALNAYNLQVAFHEIVTNDIPKLYICSGSGFQTKEEFRTFLEWNSQVFGDNYLGIDRNADDERIQEELDREAHLNETVLYPYTEKMGNCEVVFLGGAHLIYIQKPDECGEVLKSFIDGLDS